MQSNIELAQVEITGSCLVYVQNKETKKFSDFSGTKPQERIGFSLSSETLKICSVHLNMEQKSCKS